MDEQKKNLKRVLLVEGKDDLHVVAHLLKRHKLEGLIEIRDNEGVEKVKDALKKGTFEILLRDLKEEIKADNDYLGLVVDANTSPEARWQSLTNRLKELGYSNLPTKPDSNGTVINGKSLLPTIGIWIMPDNSDKGMLEHFLSKLVPKDREELWQIAQDTVDNLPTKRFVHAIADHTMKAKVHTYLAWQEEPGKPYGVAVSEKYFEANSPNAQKFIAWIRRLFDLEEKTESNIPQN